MITTALAVGLCFAVLALAYELYQNLKLENQVDEITKKFHEEEQARIQASSRALIAERERDALQQQDQRHGFIRDVCAGLSRHSRMTCTKPVLLELFPDRPIEQVAYYIREEVRLMTNRTIDSEERHGAIVFTVRR